MNTDQFRHVVSTFLDGQTPRVWSFLVTVFGELSQGREICISGAVLSQICAEIGIKPEAMRVALHRLRKNGWIESHKSGRNSEYSLTQFGRDETRAASPVIYARHPSCQHAWLCVCNGSREQKRPSATVSLGAQAFITGQQPAASDVFAHKIESPSELPLWMRHKICPPDVVNDSGNLARLLADLNQALPDSSELLPLQTTIIRILAVHSWRRIALKIPDLPDHIFGATWAGASCRAEFHKILTRFTQNNSDILT